MELGILWVGSSSLPRPMISHMLKTGMRLTLVPAFLACFVSFAQHKVISTYGPCPDWVLIVFKGHIAAT